MWHSGCYICSCHNTLPSTFAEVAGEPEHAHACIPLRNVSSCVSIAATSNGEALGFQFTSRDARCKLERLYPVKETSSD